MVLYSLYCYHYTDSNGTVIMTDVTGRQNKVLVITWGKKRRECSTYLTILIISKEKFCYNDTIHFLVILPVSSVTATDAICLQLLLPHNCRQSKRHDTIRYDTIRYDTIRYAVAITVTAALLLQAELNFIAEFHVIEFHTDRNLRSFSQDHCGQTAS